MSDAEASFLDLYLSISDGFVKTKGGGVSIRGYSGPLPDDLIFCPLVCVKGLQFAITWTKECLN